MSDPGIVAIRIVHGSNVFHVHGDNAGDEGVYLAAGQVQGLYEAPVKTTYKTGAFQRGSWQKYRKFMQRDLQLGFHVRDTFTEYELNESLFRQIFDYQLDPWEVDPTPTTIEVETTLSGVRKLDVLMYEQPDFAPDLDPMMQQYGNHIFKLRAGQPFWYQDDYVSTFTGSGAAASGTLTVQNPTDVEAYQKFVLTVGTWTLPDVEWVGSKGSRAPGGPNAANTVGGIVITTANGGAVADIDRQALMFRDANDTNLLAQMAGKFLNYSIPPYTPPTPIPISYTAGGSGAQCQLRVPQLWSRPWGMELPGLLGTPVAPYITRIMGTSGYVIPGWANTVDYVILGGGGGGQAGTGPLLGLHDGFGGDGGQFAYGTLVRGTDIPWTTTEINVTIGAGGAGGSFIIGQQAPTDGTPTTITATGMTSHTGAGGHGGVNSNHIGLGAGTITYNGIDYTTGPDATTQGQPGSTPGGGGAGGYVAIGNGGAGGRGQAWFRAY